MRHRLRTESASVAINIESATSPEVHEDQEAEPRYERPSAHPCDKSSSPHWASELGRPRDAIVTILLKHVVVQRLPHSCLGVAEHLDPDIPCHSSWTLLAVEVVELYSGCWLRLIDQLPLHPPHLPEPEAVSFLAHLIRGSADRLSQRHAGLGDVVGVRADVEVVHVPVPVIGIPVPLPWRSSQSCKVEGISTRECVTARLRAYNCASRQHQKDSQSTPCHGRGDRA
mmetsp:Transcript_20177/g.45890  ORF Transcript_20177/g.45890 Transcript_20177/m.45890 type:complete len:227 (-) Transcript_20177:13-693(-)